MKMTMIPVHFGAVIHVKAQAVLVTIVFVPSIQMIAMKKQIRF